MTLTDDIDGTMLLSFYGAGLALGFKGSPGFIERSFNWAVNRGVVPPGTELQWFYDVGGKLAYVCPKSTVDVMRGLKEQFRGEIVSSHEIEPIWVDEDEGYLTAESEAQVCALAESRANDYMKDRIELVNFMIKRVTSIAPVYSMGVVSADRGE